ncbi:MAG: hypothetical protein ACYDBB_21580 [Armatimonadota bacterium]
MSTTGYRLYLDTHYDVHPWPFGCSWQEVLSQWPDMLPGAVADFDIFLPDDHYNRSHGLLDRQHASVKSEMAIYRDGEAVIVLMRLWHGDPLPVRFAPANEEGASVVLMADATSDDGLYVGVNPAGEYLAARWTGLNPDCSEVGMQWHPQPPDTCRVMTAPTAESWLAVFHVPLAAIPGIAAGADTVRFTAGRLWGETFEPSAWATATVWAPQPAEMGTLHLTPRLPATSPYLYRADFYYEAETERGELAFTVAGLPQGQTTDMQVALNTRKSQHCCSGVVRQAWTPEEGENAIMVKVGVERFRTLYLEKWSGHQLFVRYPSAQPLPDTADLRERFRQWHDQQEQKYTAPGTWGDGLDHGCAFPMEPYALYSLYVERQPVYLERVTAACERILQSQTPDGVFLCYHFGDAPRPFEGGAFTQGSASEALLLGYRLFGDARYLAAAQRGAEAYHLYALEYNTNYMAFVLWHLAELYELTGESIHLERALWYTQYGILRGMNPSGAHPGHNYYSAYGGITLKGLAKLLRMLPADHAFYPTLKEHTLRYTNQILSRQRVNGLIDGRNRMYFGYQHTAPGLFDVARALPGEVADTLQPAMVATYYAHPHVGGSTDGLVVALMGRYVAEMVITA